MAQERFIHGKRDSCKHDGLYANTKRLQAAKDHYRDFINGVLTKGDDSDLLEVETIVSDRLDETPTPVDSSFFVAKNIRHGVPSTKNQSSLEELQGQEGRGR